MSGGMELILDAFRTHIEYLMPTEIAEKYRVLSTGKFKGDFSFRRSPYTREYVDTLSPECIYRVIGSEKGSQIGLTMAGMANILLAIMKQYQADVLFMSDTEDQVKRAMEGFIDDMIRESGLSDVIGKKNTRTRKKSGSGDTSKEKKYGDDHTLYTWSGQTVGKLSSISPKYSLNDEFERYKFTDKKAGSPYMLIMNRHKTYSGEYKAYFNSTPELLATSNIHPVFLQGDQKFYFLPCPHCGADIDLQWHVHLEGKDVAGIHYKRNNLGGLIEKSVGYVCQECGGFFKEKHKLEMYNESEYQIKNGGGMMWKDNRYLIKDSVSRGNPEEPLCHWKATAIPKDPDYGSYHISALYSGSGFHTWTAIAKEWCLANPINAPKNLDMLKTFYNQELGKPWEDKTRQIKGTKLLKNCRNYEPCIIPDELCIEDGNGKIVALTLAVDLNGIMDDDNPENDDVRLDWSVFAYPEKGNDEYNNKYAIAHGSIGNFERASEKRDREAKGLSRKAKFTCRHGEKNNVWDVLDKEVLFKEWDSQSGRKWKIMICGIDSGTFTVHANQYVDKYQICVALKGENENKFVNVDADKKYVKKGTKTNLWLLEGNRLKDRLYEALQLDWDASKNIPQPTGYINYPQPSGNMFQYQTYFVEYEGEKRQVEKDVLGNPKGVRWGKKSTTARQHFWDCHHYNDACAKILYYNICDYYKIDPSWENYATIMKNK